MTATPISSRLNLLLLPTCHSCLSPVSTVSSAFSNKKTIRSAPKLIFICKSTPNSSDSDLVTEDQNSSEEPRLLPRDSESQPIYDDYIEIEIEKLGKNSRRISARIIIDANLEIIWNLLTDYEKLSDFIPGLTMSRLIEKRENFARLFQLGQQDLAFGMKFKAKGILDCYEKDLENLPFGRKRDIEFKMVEGDFETFEGKWSIEQANNGRDEVAQAYQTTLSYIVDVKPKLWLPVRLVEGRVCREIKMNLLCIREESEKVARPPQLTISA